MATSNDAAIFFSLHPPSEPGGTGAFDPPAAKGEAFRAGNLHGFSSFEKNCEEAQETNPSADGLVSGGENAPVL